MKVEHMNEILFYLTIAANLISIAYFAGRLKAQQEAHAKTIEEIKKSFKETVEDIKKDFKDKLHDIKENISEKIAENAKHFEDNIRRLEHKQDKHNSTIERTFLLEKQQGVLVEQMKVANHRIEDIETKIG